MFLLHGSPPEWNVFPGATFVPSFTLVLPFDDPFSAAVAQWNRAWSCVVCVGGDAMGTVLDHRRCAEECTARARLAEDNGEKALWLALAQSWVRLAEQVAHAEAGLAPNAAFEPIEEQAS